MLLYQPLGDGSEKVYLYNTPDKKKLQKQERKTSQTRFKKMLKSHISPKRRNGPIKSLGKTLFYFADNDNQFAKQENTFNVASDWLVLSADQAKN